VRVVAAVPAAGLLAGSACGIPLSDLPVPLGLALLFGLAIAAVWMRSRATPLTFGAVICAAFFVGGVILSAHAWRDAWRPTLRAAFEELARQERVRAGTRGRRLPEDDEAFAIVTGVLRSDAAPAASGVSLSIEVDSIESGTTEGHSNAAPRGGTGWPVSGGLQATVVGTLAVDLMGNWRAGRRVRLPVQLRRPSRYLNPGVLDNERALARRGTTLVGTVKSGALVDVVARGGFIDEQTGRIRAFARRAVFSAVGSWSERSAAIVAAIVIGDRTELDPGLQRRLQEAGTYHVIAISGGNIAIVAAALLGVFRLAGMLGRGAMLAAIGALLVYERIVGGGASVDRATLMAVVYFAARAIDQRSLPLNALAFVSGCLVAVEPLSIVDPAFVLTSGATLSILLIVPLVQSWNLPREAAWIAGMLAASIVTQVALLPVGALMFSRITFAGVALNFVAIPLMTLAQVAGMFLIPTALVSQHAASVAGYVAHLGAAGLVRSADLVQIAPALSIRVAPPGVWAVVAYYLALVSACLTRRRLWQGRAFATAAVLAAVWMVAEPWAVVARRGDGQMHITFLDVGQGDAAFVRFPHGGTMLIDSGGLSQRSSFDIGDRVVAPVLRTNGVRRLDFMVLTHGDPDHIGGAASIVREFRPREVWEGIPVPPFEPLRQLHAESLAVDSKWSNVKAGDRRQVDDVEIVILHPETPDWERQRVRNDDSIVLDLRWRDVSVLLTGDVGQAVERTRLTGIQASAIRVVKIPHHGSLTSSSMEFVRGLAPTIAVVSAGRANHFGHPVPAVLQRYQDTGAEVFRTDRDGAVTIETDGKSVDVHSFLGRRLACSQDGSHEGTKDTKTKCRQGSHDQDSSKRTNIE
jgi:competence protein ComEC